MRPGALPCRTAAGSAAVPGALPCRTADTTGSAAVPDCRKLDSEMLAVPEDRISGNLLQGSQGAR